jgi:hypothetical protein
MLTAERWLPIQRDGEGKTSSPPTTMGVREPRGSDSIEGSSGQNARPSHARSQ